MSVRFKVTHYDKELVPPDDSRPAAVSVRVIVNGLVAGKSTVAIDGWRRLTAEEAEAEAHKQAITMAFGRVVKWQRAIDQWNEWAHHGANQQ